MFDFRRKIAHSLRIFFEERGIEPIHAVTVLFILVLFSYRNDLKNWESTSSHTQGMIILGMIAATLLMILSVLMLLGVIKE